MTNSTALKTDRDFGVLLVEDDATALDELTEIVDLEGWTPYAASSVNKALDILARTPSIGVVVTDVHFVDENGESDNGIQLISRAQARFPDRGLSFVVLSGDPDSLRSSVLTGAVDFLNKPLNSDELVSAIEAAWQSGGEERTVTELTEFLLEKMQKTASALKMANDDLQQVSLDQGEQMQADSMNLKAKLIRRALRNGNLLPWLQPQVDLSTGKLYGFDTVARWIDADGEVKNAESILEFARQAKAQEEVDSAIRSAAIRAMSFFGKTGLNDCVITLYTSPEFLNTLGSVDDVVNEAVGIGLEPEQLKFELPAGLDLDGPNKKVVLKNLACMPKRVLRIDLDSSCDFSHVAALQGIGFDQINLDLSQAQGFHLQSEQQSVARALIGLASAMGIEVNARGVKNPNELAWLKDNGCVIVQGDHISKPLPVDDALIWAQNKQSSAKEEV
ncbi:putative membrane protein YjcC [Pelagimonas phthalicica]|uniref:Putative membrane protein YjcC n=1 Tax=Pelagimonas phthalicica TaxID=1037362 RepID=A0A238J6N4_9RHOB|nr:EAL domain-containing protein [Pelagimonas phthalicica]TDS95227.1 EAL domain-containing protein (putative c-di-GMP-specific phosphodiesterase class I) [Pelagimonas phthalicica]SMX26249.1 putative membrane protein YjcC [Pelagimonas phthalicica]